ncbi:glycoside hydrolase [Spirosoma sp. BT702]|uniref:Glycoside hydrolase n=1 Tax=Spirosoma profusum TaxID=2771354 RepID=A0A926XZ05_9BACT|nr:glycosyl hydrolase [Spirosoma profusum]MBD2702826.1 glycoside hydrolase [Spirosoma profusum]
MRTTSYFLFLYVSLLSSVVAQNVAQQAGGLSEATFATPPSRYGIRCWWWWLNGNVTKEAITRDLEAMRAKGFSGACIFDAGGAEQRGNAQVPEGPMFGSPAWRELYFHAVREANRLGLVLSMSIQSGWNLGGPDITPAEAAKQLIWSEITVRGPVTYRQALPKPTEKTGTQPAKHESDGFYRDVAVLAFPKSTSTHLPIRDLKAKSGTVELGGSAPDTRFLLTDVAPTPGEADTSPKAVQNLTAHLTAQGVLEWQVPVGEWTIMRFGYGPTSADVSTSSGKWQGRVLDPLNAKTFNRYWDTHVEPMLKMIGPLAGKTLKYLQTDSWEAGGCNWTDAFAQEFRKRRGYDILPYLPVVTGKIVGNRDESNRFLADLRKTISDCVAENHYAVFAERARKYGIGLQPESAGPHAGPFDGLKNYGYSEIMMSEFWSPSPHRPTPVNRFFVKQASSAAHIYNKPLVGAESFTTIGPHWNDVIWSAMKSSADHEFCAGLNLVYLHTFTCSPKEMGLPGQEYFAGTHFNPNVTWWDLSDGFIQYLMRCQYVLQQGQSVSDVLYYYGDHVPNIARQKADDPAHALPEFDYDIINEDRLMVLTVKNGRITLPHGLSYRVLVLPDHKILSLAALRKVSQLVQAGATVIGPKPNSTASLVGYPASETERKLLTNQLWGATTSESDEPTRGEHRTGTGRVIWGKTAREVLLSDNIQPDAELAGPGGMDFDYVHKTINGEDIYFVSNQNPETAQLKATFRISGRRPELWNPVTGEILPATAFFQQDGQTTVPLTLSPYGSVFVIFRKSIPTTQQGTATKLNALTYRPVKTLSGSWQVQFDSKWTAGSPSTVTFDTLVSWTTRPEDGIHFYSGKATYRKTFDAPANVTGTLFLDLGSIQDVGVARVRLNGQDLGIVWAPPFRVNVAKWLKPTGNQLEIDVVNSWRNRLIGDREKPKEQRLTQTNITVRPDWQLQTSGLLGPVQLLAATDQ